MQTLALANMFNAPDTAMSPPTPTTPENGTPYWYASSAPSYADWYAANVPKPIRVFYAVARVVSPVACIYHGYKRNDSIGWALGWGLLGFFFPVVTPTVAVAQGFGKTARSGLGRSRRRRTFRGRRSRRTR